MGIFDQITMVSQREPGHTLLWAEISREQTNEIMKQSTYGEISELLIKYLAIEDPQSTKNEALLKFYVMNLRFAAESSFPDTKTSTLFSVLKLAHFTSMERNLPANQSQLELHSLLLAHSIEHPPYSIAVFSPVDVRSIMDFATDTYYRHYRLYRYVFTPRQLLELAVAPERVELPPSLAALAGATPQGQMESVDVPCEPEPPEVVPPTEEELEQQQKEKDTEVLEDPKSEMIQQLVAKRLENIKEGLDAELQAKQTEYQERMDAAQTAGS